MRGPTPAAQLFTEVNALPHHWPSGGGQGSEEPGSLRESQWAKAAGLSHVEAPSGKSAQPIPARPRSPQHLSPSLTISQSGFSS